MIVSTSHDNPSGFERPPGLFITDFDGTLRTTSGTIAERDLETLRALGKDGYIRIVATGRSLYSLRRAVDDSFPIDYVVFSSGAGVLDYQQQRIIRKVDLDAEELRRIVAILLDLEKDFMIHEPIPNNHSFRYHSTGRDNPDFIRRCELYREHCRPFAGDTATLGLGAQLLVIEPTDGRRGGPATGTSGTGTSASGTSASGTTPTLALLQSCLPNCSIIRTTSPLDGQSVWIEIFPASVSKGRTTAWLAEMYGLGPDNSLAVGNDFNDESLLEWAGNAFVVANAPQELRQRFSVVSSNDECGITEAVRRWLNKI